MSTQSAQVASKPTPIECSNSLNAPPAGRRRRRPSVHFNPTVLVTEIEHISDLTLEGLVSEIWFTASEYDAFKKDVKLTLKLHKTGILQVDVCDELCMRGLEGRTKEGSLRRKQNKFEAVDTVLFEQGRQLLDYPDKPADPQAISDAYQDVSYMCQKQAQAVAAQDELYVQQLLQNSKDGNEELSASRTSPAEAASSIRRMMGFQKFINSLAFDFADLGH